jgi:aminoglycoside phosphotransferase (APT) family kinase protein
MSVDTRPANLPDVAAVREALVEAGETDIGRNVRLQPLGLGASRECWLVHTGMRRYVLKRDPVSERSPATSRLQEYRVLNAAAAAGVPVARPVCAEPVGGRFGTPGFLTEFVAGTASPRKLVALDESSRTRVLREVGSALGRLAGADLRDLDLVWDIGSQTSVAPDADDAVPAVLEGLASEIDELASDRPAFALGLRWAERNRPPPAKPVLVHGDFRLGNLIVDEQGLRAVVDWEFSRYGDIAEDLAFFCLRPWRFGRDALQAGGLGSREVLLAGYAAEAGTSVPSERVHFWQVVGQLRWGLYCLRNAAGYGKGEHKSLERLLLGRRAAETEWDVLSLIQESMPT